MARRGQGSFVAARSTSIKKRERLRFVEDMIRKLLVEAYHLNLSLSEIHELMGKVEASLRAGRAPAPDSSDTPSAVDAKEKIS